MCSALPTKADVALMKSIPRAPDAADAPHVARWYKNIASYSALEVYVCRRGRGRHAVASRACAGGGRCAAGAARGLAQR